MVDQKVKKFSFFALLFLIVIVFIAGILFGRYMGDSQLSEVEDFIKQNELNSESYIVEQDFIKSIGQYDCDLAKRRVEHLSNELADIGRTLSKEGTEEQIGEKNFVFLKRRYHLMQIRTYSFFKRLKEACNQTSDVAVFFYGLDEDSVEQGKVLDRIVEDYHIKVFAIQFNYSKELNFFGDYYGIEETPAMIINFEDKEQGLKSYEELEPSFKT